MATLHRLLLRVPSHSRIWRGSCRKYTNAIYKDLLKLHERGVLQAFNPEERTPAFVKLLSSPQSVYCGFDPTADSLHVGNLLAIILLVHCQRAGHSPIALIGGATARIGDPSGKTKDREPMGLETVEHNIQCLQENLERIFNNHRHYIWKDPLIPLSDLKVLNNQQFYADKNVIDFLSTVGRFFRLGPMLAKKSVQTRLASLDGMCFTEFTYQMFQSYDWLQLLTNHNCKIQVGGIDQLGNIQAGSDFINKTTQANVYSLMVPLITSADGKKLGKTEDGAVWLSPEKTTPYAFYQYFINTADSDAELHLKLFTFYAATDIENIMSKHKQAPGKRYAQKKLAEQAVLLVHGAEGLVEAERWTEAFWSNKPESLANLSTDELERLFDNVHTVELFLEPDISVLDLTLKSKSFVNEAKARNTIEAGGVYINLRRVTEPDILLIQGEHILPNQVTLLRIGKKNYKIIKWVS